MVRVDTYFAEQFFFSFLNFLLIFHISLTQDTSKNNWILFYQAIQYANPIWSRQFTIHSTCSQNYKKWILYRKYWSTFFPFTFPLIDGYCFYFGICSKLMKSRSEAVSSIRKLASCCRLRYVIFVLTRTSMMQLFPIPMANELVKMMISSSKI